MAVAQPDHILRAVHLHGLSSFPPPLPLLSPPCCTKPLHSALCPAYPWRPQSPLPPPEPCLPLLRWCPAFLSLFSLLRAGTAQLGESTSLSEWDGAGPRVLPQHPSCSPKMRSPPPSLKRPKPLGLSSLPPATSPSCFAANPV